MVQAAVVGAGKPGERRLAEHEPTLALGGSPSASPNPLRILSGSFTWFAMRVAFIGNSYTFFNDLPTMFATLAALLPSPINVTHLQATPGGSSIADHANASTTAGKETRMLLDAPGGWDYVVLQDQSQTPGGGRDGDSGEAAGVARSEAEATLRSFYAPVLAALQATPVLYSTWGRHDGDPLNAECCGYGTFVGMTDKTTVGYSRYAEILQEASSRARAPAAAPPVTVPCGRAFELVYNGTRHPLADDSLFSCLYHHGGARPRAQLPSERSSRGDSCTLDEYGLGGHPSPLGTYLIACTFVAALLKQSPVGITWAPDGVTDAQRDRMQDVAAQAARMAARVPPWR